MPRRAPLRWPLTVAPFARTHLRARVFIASGLLHALGCHGERPARELDAGPAATGTTEPASEDGAAREAGAESDGGTRYGSRNGARLRVRHYEPRDGHGPGLQHDVFDAELDAACAFIDTGERTDAGALQRCLPPPLSLGSTFSDPSCSAPAVLVDLRCASGEPGTPLVNYTHSGSGCAPPVPTFYALGEALTDGAAYQRSGATCAPVAATGPAAFRYGPLELARYQAGARRVLATERTDLGVIATESDDGLRLSQGAWYQGGACLPYVHDAANVCVSQSWSRLGEAFEGGDCTGGPLAAVYTSSCSDSLVGPLLAEFDDQPGSPSCGSLLALRELGREVEAASSTTYGTCRPVDIVDTVHYFAPGAAVDASAYLAIEPFERGDGRLRLRGFRTLDQGVELLSAAFYDTELELSCVPLETTEAITRCLPNAYVTAGTWYADASCTTELAQLGSAPRCIDDATTVYAVRRTGTGTCANPLRVAGAGRYLRFAATRVYRRNAAGDCSEVALDPTVASGLWESVEDIPLARFVELVLR